MNVAHRPEELEPARRAVAIGTFDGVHRGHRRVLEAACAARLRSTVVTFDPHPRTVFGSRIELLTTLERRLELLEESGVEDALVLRFDEALGFDVRRVPLVDNVSSSHVRALLTAGDVVHAAKLLGRPAEVEGAVGHGDHRGATLGFPTANLVVPPDLLVPALGIYAGTALGQRAAISIGTNPHYGGTERRVEAYLLDYEGALYGRRVVLELWERLRDEAAFASEAELIAAIDDDVRRTRKAVRPG